MVLQSMLHVWCNVICHSVVSLFDVLVTVLALISLVTLFFPPSLAEVVEEVCDFMSRHKIRLYV